MEHNEVTEGDFLKKYNHLLPPRNLSDEEVEQLKEWSRRGWWSSGPRRQSYCSPLFKCNHCSSKAKKLKQVSYHFNNSNDLTQKCQMTRPTQPYKVSSVRIFLYDNY